MQDKIHQRLGHFLCSPSDGAKIYTQEEVKARHVALQGECTTPSPPTAPVAASSSFSRHRYHGNGHPCPDLAQPPPPPPAPTASPPPPPRCRLSGPRHVACLPPQSFSLRSPGVGKKRDRERMRGDDVALQRNRCGLGSVWERSVEHTLTENRSLAAKCIFQ
jgi:hypothetical protein